MICLSSPLVTLFTMTVLVASKPGTLNLLLGHHCLLCVAGSPSSSPHVVFMRQMWMESLLTFLSRSLYHTHSGKPHGAPEGYSSCLDPSRAHVLAGGFGGDWIMNV